MNTYEEGKQYLDQIGIDISKVTKEIGDYIFAILDDRNINIDEIKCFAAPQTPPEDILDALGLNIEYFKGKNILDLGGGFNGMPFVLEKYVNQYIVCDPCFEVKDKAFERALKAQEFMIEFNKITLNEHIEKLEQLKLDNLTGSDRYKDIVRSKNISSISLEKKVQVWNYINMRQNFEQGKYKNIILNPSKGEDIKGIENNSQDIVLICHILDKDYVNYNGILAEASRILKSDGEILIVEDADKEMREILIKLGLKREEKERKIVCRIKKTS